jgi:hypothetical protein
MGLWWVDTSMPADAVGIAFSGDVTAVERWSLVPPRYWRFSWRWYVLTVQDVTASPDLVMYYESNGRCQRFRTEVRTKHMAVRVGPHATTFAAFDARTKEAVPLGCLDGSFSWRKIRCVDDEQTARLAQVPYLPNITLL